MSHNIRLKGVRFTDTAMLASVVTDLSAGRASLDMNASSFRTWPGQPTNCHGAIKMPGAHDVGLLKNAEGAFEPVFDPYNMDNVFAGRSNKIGGLMQEYALRQAEYEAAQNGMTSTRIKGKDGMVTLEMTQ